MTKTLSIICFFVFFTGFSQYHSFTINGKVLDKKTKQPIEEVTVYLEKIKDSSVISYSITDTKGRFKLQDKIADQFANLYFSYIGYKTVRKKIDLSKKELTIPNVLLEEETNTLGEVLITSTPPIRIKKDTLEFNAKSFKTKKGASVEDLLKKLPGVEVSKDGKIMVNGKSVSKILVNGKEFFANDPTIATRNLTKDIIEKVQISDTKTKSQAFTGEEGDKTSKTINLTIKKENNKGVFGRVSAGAGTQKLYEAAGILNYFNDKRHISVLAGTNNLNSPGFSFGEITQMLGDGRRRRSTSISINNGVMSFGINGINFGGGQGLTTSSNIGANYADELAKGIDFTSDYFYSNAESNNKTKLHREYTLPDRKYRTDSEATSFNSNDNHNFDIRTEIKIDSTMHVEINGDFSLSKNKSENNQLISSKNIDNTLINNSTKHQFSDSENKKFSTEIEFRKKIGIRGAYLGFKINSDIDDNNSLSLYNNQVTIKDDASLNTIQNQKIDKKYDERKIGFNAQYNIPLVAKSKRNGLFLKLEYEISNNKTTDKKSTFDVQDAEKNIFNTTQSTDFSFKNQQHEATAGLRYRSKKGSISTKVMFKKQFLENKDYLRPELNLKKDYSFIDFRSYLWRKISSKTRFSVGYRFKNTVPNLLYLQAFEDRSDPLNIVTGNPNLNHEQSHSINGSLNSFNFQKKEGLFTYFGGNYANNKAIAKSTVDKNLVIRTTYTNVSGDYNYYIGTTYQKTLKIDSIHNAKFSLGINFSGNKYKNYRNSQLYSSNTRNIGPKVGINLSGKYWEINPSYKMSYNKNTFDIASFKAQNYITHRANVISKITFFKKLEWSNNLTYNYYPDRSSSGLEENFWMLNSSLSYSFLKDQAMLTLKAYDILNQNNNFSRSLNSNYIEEKTSSIIQQYVMLSFSWKFNSLGKKGKSRGAGFPSIIF